MVRFFLLIPVLAFSIYPFLDHPPFFVFNDGFVIVDLESSTPSTLTIYVRTDEDSFLLVDGEDKRHRVKIPVFENFDYDLKAGNFRMKGKITFPSERLKKARFLLIGDTRGSELIGKFIDWGLKKSVDFLIHLGDIALFDFIDDDWERFFESVSRFGKIVFIAAGNHEFPGFRYSEYLYPLNYSFRVGKYNFIVVDGGTFPEVIEENVKMRLDEKAENVLIIHEPFLSCSKHSEDFFAKIQKGLLKKLPDMGIKLVISSHDHNYQRIEKDGIVQLIIGGGGAPVYRVNRNCDGLKAWSEKPSLAIMEVGDSLKFTVYTLDGELIDEVKVK